MNSFLFIASPRRESSIITRPAHQNEGKRPNEYLSNTVVACRVKPYHVVSLLQKFLYTKAIPYTLLTAPVLLCATASNSRAGLARPETAPSLCLVNISLVTSRLMKLGRRRQGSPTMTAGRREASWKSAGQGQDIGENVMAKALAGPLPLRASACSGIPNTTGVAQPLSMICMRLPDSQNRPLSGSTVPIAMVGSMPGDNIFTCSAFSSNPSVHLSTSNPTAAPTIPRQTINTVHDKTSYGNLDTKCWCGQHRPEYSTPSY